MLISESLVSKLLDIERANSAISSSGISAKRYSKYVRDAVIDSLFYLGKIYFPKITSQDCKKIAKAREISEYQLLTNYRKSLEYIRYQAEFSPLNGTIANHINKLMSDNIIENWQPKTISTKSRYDSKYDFTKTRPEETDTIENIIMLTQKMDLSILRASEVFLYTVKYKPFMALNDITALLLLTYECTRFYEKSSFIVSYPKILLFDRDIDDIIETNEVLNVLVSGIHDEITDLKDRILKHSYQDKVDKNSKYADLTERQLAILRYLQNNPRVNRRQYMKLFKVSTMTAFRDLNDLVEKKIISVKGIGRGTYYELIKS